MQRERHPGKEKGILLVSEIGVSLSDIMDIWDIQGENGITKLGRPRGRVSRFDSFVSMCP